MPRRNRNFNSSWEPDNAKPDPPRSCPVTGKRMYANEREAKATASHRMSDAQSAPSRLRIYKCVQCGAYHLTSKEP
jgi:hypothetical protein